MINSKDIEVFNRAVKSNYKFNKLGNSLYFAQIPKDKLGAFNLVVSDAGIYLYKYPNHSGSFFEIVYKLSGGHFNTALIGKVEDGEFVKFNLKDFPDEITVLPRKIEKQINDKITQNLK